MVRITRICDTKGCNYALELDSDGDIQEGRISGHGIAIVQSAYLCPACIKEKVKKGVKA